MPPQPLQLLMLGVLALVAGLILRKFFWLETTLIQCVTWPVMAVLVLLLHHIIIIEIGVGVVETWLWMLVLRIGLRKAAAVSAS